MKTKLYARGYYDNVDSIKIGLLPYDPKVNSYIKEIREILGRLGNVVKVPRPKGLLIQLLTRFLTTGRLVLYDVLILNFRENVIKSKNNSISFVGSIEFFFVLILQKLASRKLIFIRHDIHPHNICKKHTKLSAKIIDLGQSIADVVVTHSPAYAKSNGCYYVPHPLYKFEDLPIRDIERSGYFVVFGIIERYKNIDKIIKYISEDVELIVMGPCNDWKYLKELKKIASGKNIIFEVDFHSDEYLQKRISSSSGVVITNATSSMLVSGSFFYAISCGTRVYTLDVPFMKWVKSTSLGSYITVEPNVELLMKSMNCVDVKTNERSEILKHAEFLFGDSSVEKAWQKALSIKDKNN